jgi:hypothetical protein
MSFLFENDGLDEQTRIELAAAWRTRAARAYATVAEASQQSVDLVTLGASPELIAHATGVSADAIKEASACFAIARRIDGRDVEPRPGTGSNRRPRAGRHAVAIVTLAVTALDVAFGAGIASRVDTKLARRATDPTVRALLEELAAFHARRASHAWAIIAWSMMHAPSASVVEAALASLLSAQTDRHMEGLLSEQPAIAREGGWERWGIASEAVVRAAAASVQGVAARRVRVRGARGRAAIHTGEMIDEPGRSFSLDDAPESVAA